MRIKPENWKDVVDNAKNMITGGPVVPSEENPEDSEEDNSSSEDMELLESESEFSSLTESASEDDF